MSSRYVFMSSEQADADADQREAMQDFLRWPQLPISGDWEYLEGLGVKRGENSDDLFCRVTLPEGWKIEMPHSSIPNHARLLKNGKIVAHIWYTLSKQEAFFKVI